MIGGNLGTPRVPAFPLILASISIAEGAHAVVFALLPAFDLRSDSALSLALPLALFCLPPFVVHPALRWSGLSKHVGQYPERSMVAALVLEAVAAVLLAIAAERPSVTVGPGSLQMPAWFAASMLFAGTGRCLAQSQAIALVSSYLPSVEYRRDLGIHLGVLESVTAATSVVVPLVTVGALCLAGFNALAIFVAFAVLQIAILPVAARRLLSRPSSSASRLAGPTDIGTASAATTSLRETLQCTVALVRESKTFVPLSAMWLAAASSVFLRPLLAAHVVNDQMRSVFVSAVFFALMVAVALASDAVASATLVPWVGRRIVILCGLAMAAIGYRFFALFPWLGFLAVSVIAAGAGSAVTLSLGDLDDAATYVPGTSMDVLVFTSFLVCASGEAFGMLFAGYLRDRTGSFTLAVDAFSQFIAVGLVLLLLPDILSALHSCLAPRGTSAAIPEEHGETAPLLPPA